VSFDNIANIYDETRSIPKVVLDRFYWKFIGNEIRSGSFLTVLDAGVGTGRIVEPLFDSKVQLIGIDISREMLKRMSEKIKRRAASDHVHLVLGDVSNLPFPAKAFDMVISVHVLHLLSNWKQAIKETKRTLKPKSPFIVAKHGEPELETEVGRRYTEIVQYSFGSAQARMLKRFLTRTRMNLLSTIFERVVKYTSLETGRYLRGKASSVENYAITWKETMSVSKVADRLNKRLLSLKWAMSTETFEKLKRQLNQWTIESAGNNPFLEIKLEFEFSVVRF
jgi:ubiquinone/menaquinone biosynthesis C-methylase UbiE